MNLTFRELQTKLSWQVEAQRCFDKFLRWVNYASDLCPISIECGNKFNLLSWSSHSQFKSHKISFRWWDSVDTKQLRGTDKLCDHPRNVQSSQISSPIHRGWLYKMNEKLFEKYIRSNDLWNCVKRNDFVNYLINVAQTEEVWSVKSTEEHFAMPNWVNSNEFLTTKQRMRNKSFEQTLQVKRWIKNDLHICFPSLRFCLLYQSSFSPFSEYLFA